MELREKVRAWLIDARFGVIGPEALLARVDRTIGELDRPPDYLLALSLGEPLRHVPRLDLVRDPIAEVDLGALAKRLLDRLDRELMSLEAIATVATGVSFPRADEAGEALAWFAWIADQSHLIDEGAADRTGFREAVIAALCKAAECAPE